MNIVGYLDSVIWAGLTVIFIIVEAITAGLITIWFAIGALAATLTSIYIDDPKWQILCFLMISIATLLLTRKFKIKVLNKSRVETNTPAIIGTIGIVTKKISHLEKGRATVEGKDWLAMIEENERREILEGEEIQVIAIRGVTLVVKKV